VIPDIPLPVTGEPSNREFQRKSLHRTILCESTAIQPVTMRVTGYPAEKAAFFFGDYE
jgi:hypothetical protein